IDVRVIAATHRDLEAEISAGRFREDLYYRLNVIPLVTPSLRERASDVPLLLQHFAKRFAVRGANPVRFRMDFLEALQNYAWPGNVRELSNLVDRFSTLYAGKELDLRTIPATLLPKGLHALRASLSPMPCTATKESLSAPATDAFGLPEGLLEMDEQPTLEDREVENIIMLAQGLPQLPPDGISLKERLADIERSMIEQALQRSQGNVSRTAKLLNLQRTTLIEKINKYELKYG
ncbi:MAG: sigma-54-dependent Fis family transcriptional regulator, partial [Betaproteobacteria bacterium]|nr:sigma-54-dependent Fis family transcriptional regulator [Betaproteobacteria bacterium]